MHAFRLHARRHCKVLVPRQQETAQSCFAPGFALGAFRSSKRSLMNEQQASVAARQPRPALPARTIGPGRHVVLFDGRCKFCRVNAEPCGLGKPGVLNLEDFQKQGTLDAFPGLTHDICMRT